MLDFLGLDLLASWIPISFFPSVKRCYNAARVRTIFTTRAAFRSIHTDVLPIFQQRNLIYKFQCHFNATYIGRIALGLELNSMFREIFVTTQHPDIQNCSILPFMRILMPEIVVWLITAMSVLWLCIKQGRNILLSWRPFILYLIGLLYANKTPQTLWIYLEISLAWLRVVLNFSFLPPFALLSFSFSTPPFT